MHQTADSAARVKTFDATCGVLHPILKTTARHLPPGPKHQLEEKIMTMREKLEGGIFAVILIVGIPALIAATQAF